MEFLTCSIVCDKIKSTFVLAKKIRKVLLLLMNRRSESVLCRSLRVRGTTSGRRRRGDADHLDTVTKNLPYSVCTY